MIIQLVDRNEEMCSRWEKYFSGCQDVKIHCGEFFSLKTDCVVSPANSFGFMDGGLDWVITSTLGFQVQGLLQKIIKEKYDGELLVGQAVAVETDNIKVPYCIAAPTMRVPMIIKNTVNVYLAMRAILLLLKSAPQFLPIQTITISGLGTGVGRVPYDICARQMKRAYNEIIKNKYEFPKNWHDAQKKHQMLYLEEYSTSRDLQKES